MVEEDEITLQDVAARAVLLQAPLPTVPRGRQGGLHLPPVRHLRAAALAATVVQKTITGAPPLLEMAAAAAGLARARRAQVAMVRPAVS